MVFLVVGIDKGGMWHLLSEPLLNQTFDMDIESINRLHETRLLVIDSKGIVAQASGRSDFVKSCGEVNSEVLPNPETIHGDKKKEMIIYVAIISILISFILIMLLIMVCLKSKHHENDYRSEHYLEMWDTRPKVRSILSATVHPPTSDYEDIQNIDYTID